MFCKCERIEIESKQLHQELGRVWNLGPVVVSKDLNSNSLSIIGKIETFNTNVMSLSEFKRAVMSIGLDIPFTVKFSVNGNQDLYSFGETYFNDSAVCKYKKTTYTMDMVEIVLEMVAKGKELNIFNVDSNNKEQSWGKKPLFWSSILK